MPRTVPERRSTETERANERAVQEIISRIKIMTGKLTRPLVVYHDDGKDDVIVPDGRANAAKCSDQAEFGEIRRLQEAILNDQ